jgi:hypothetical protein
VGWWNEHIEQFSFGKIIVDSEEVISSPFKKYVE